MKKFEGCLILSLVLLGAFPVNAYCNTRWDEFLEHPNKDALVTLENTITASAQRCSPNVAPVQKHRTQLFELIRGGNESAFRAALLVSECWDGGEAEDFDRSAGIFFETKPHAFLQIVKEKVIHNSRLRHMLTMLPLDTVDNIDRKISVVQNRIAILKGLGDGSLEEIIKRGLSVLEKEKENLDKIKVAMDKNETRVRHIP